MESTNQPTRQTNLSDEYGTKYDGTYLYFGVCFEVLSPTILSEIIKDIVGLISVLPSKARLCVLSPTARELTARLGGALDVDFQDGRLDMPGAIWKGYYHKDVPIPPEGVVFKYLRKIPTLDDRKKIRLTPGNQPDVPVLPGDGRLVPPGVSPSTLRPTYRGPAPQGTPQLMMWSSAEAPVKDDYLSMKLRNANRGKL